MTARVLREGDRGRCILWRGRTHCGHEEAFATLCRGQTKDYDREIWNTACAPRRVSSAENTHNGHKVCWLTG